MMSRLHNALTMIRRDGTSPPNLITIFRILLAIPVMFWVLQPGALGWIGFGVYLFAVGTDWVDGYLAKRDNGRWKTELGKILDPLADKIINLAALCAIIARVNDSLRGLVITAVIIIIVREILVFWAKSRQPLASASEAGRFAMAALVVAIGLLAIPAPLPFLLPAGAILFGLGASCAAGWAYLRSPNSP